MRVLCIANTADALPEEDRESLLGQDRFPVTIGREYAVVAITWRKGFAWYYICDDHYDDEYVVFPVWKPASLFEISGPDLPRDWIFGFRRGSYPTANPILGFPEWVNDVAYYERLVAGDAGARSAFQARYHELRAGESTVHG